MGHTAINRRIRRKVYEVLEGGLGEDRLAHWVNLALIILIISNVIAFAVETLPGMGERYGVYFEAFNVISVAIFTVEYALRIWSAVEIPVFHGERPWRARLQFACNPLLIVDLLAILPFYLSFLVTIDLRVLRVLRLLRFFKLLRYSAALQSLGRVIVNEQRALLGALLIMCSLILFAATGMYFIERHAHPDAFNSVPRAVWWAVATLTTVGYGDVVPVTPAGRVFGALIMIFGLGMFALPIAIMAAGFSQESNRRAFVVTWSMVARVPLFAGLNAAHVAEIMSLLYAQSFPAGAEIFRAGDEAHSMYFVTRGEVEIDMDGGETAVLGEGDFFGEMAILERRNHVHNAVAARRSRLLVLDRDDLMRLMHHQPEIGRTIKEVAEARAKQSGAKARTTSPRISAETRAKQARAKARKTTRRTSA